LAKVNYNYYFDETALAVQYSFQFNKRLEFDVRRGNFNEIAALDLALTTNAVNIDYKNHCMTGISKPESMDLFRIILQIQLQDKTLIPNFNRVEFGTYGIVSYDLSDSFSIDTGLRYDYSRVDAAKFYLKSRWEERGYAAEFADFIVRRRQSMVGEA
jgi:iron complex outermembrane receptor protein